MGQGNRSGGRPEAGRRLRAVVGTAVVATVVCAAGLGAAAPAPAAVRPCSNGLVALTFDDGPSRDVTPRLLDVLESRRVPATFFVVGERVASAPGVTRSAYRRGFRIANHTYRHEQLTRLGDRQVVRTLRRTRSAVLAAGARPSNLMRPPYGLINARVERVVRGMGLTPVLWTVDPADWEGRSGDAIARSVLRQLRPDRRNVVLLHDGIRNSPNTLRAVPRIVRVARARGYCFAGLGSTGRPVAPVPVARISDARVTETDPGTATGLRLTVALDRPTSRRTSVRVRTVAGSAAAGRDYRGLDARLVFPVGVTRRAVVVRALGDRLDEHAERLTVTLSEPARMRIADHRGLATIVDDDAQPGLRVSDAVVTEPVAGTARALVRLRLGRASGKTVTVTARTVVATADAADFIPVEVTRTFRPGETEKTVAVEVRADVLEEPVERFTLRVVGARYATLVDGVGDVWIHPPSVT